MKITLVDDLRINVNAPFENIIYSQENDSWSFVFADNINVNPSDFWRVLKNDKIVGIPLDHGQWFGLSKPFNLQEELFMKLNGTTLIEVGIRKNTGDLILYLSDGITIEIFISSTGYETYNINVCGKRYFGLGGGDIEVLDL